jgi:hypothetical protein
MFSTINGNNEFSSIESEEMEQINGGCIDNCVDDSVKKVLQLIIGGSRK